MLQWPSVWICIGLCVGIVIEYFGHFPIYFGLYLGIFAFLVAWISHRKILYIPLFIFPLAVVLMAVALGLVMMHLKRDNIHLQNAWIQEKEGQWVVVEFQKKLKSTPFYNKYQAKLLYQIEGERLILMDAKVLIQFKKSCQTPIDFRNSYYAHAKIQRIRGPSSPSGFDYRAYMEGQGILYQCTVDELIQRKKVKDFAYQNYYHKLLTKIDSSPLSDLSKENLKALTLADRTEMNAETLSTYSIAGIMHLFAISGLHIGLLFALIYGVLIRFLGNKNETWVIVLSLLCISIYGAFIQFPTSVSRALLMLAMYYGFRLLHRPSLSFHSLAWAAIILLMINPYELFQLGFQLSFAAVFFIFWLYPDFKNVLYKWRRGLRETVAITMAAQLGTTPLSILYFHQASLGGILLNILILPFAGLLVIFSFVMMLQIVWFPEFGYFYPGYDAINEGLYQMASLVASIQPSAMQNLCISTPEIMVLFGMLIYIRTLFRSRTASKWLVLGLLICGFLSLRLYAKKHALDCNELVLYSIYKNSVISIKNGNKLQVLHSRELDSNFHRYSLKPYWLSLYKPDIAYDNLLYSELIINKQSIYFVQNKLPNTTDSQRIFVLQNSPKIDKDLLLSQPHKLIFIDGSNYPDYGNELQSYAEQNYPNANVWWAYKRGFYQTKLY